MHSFIQYLIRLSIFSLIIVVIAALLYGFVFTAYYQAIVPVALLFFMGVSMLIHYILTRSSTNNANVFLRSFMLATFVKLVICALFFALYIMNRKQDAISFTIMFFSLYVLYTSFETIALLKHTKIKQSS